MRDTRDRWRSPPAAPFRYRLQRPAALPHARRVAQRQAPRQQRARPMMTCETTGEKNALSDSGRYEDPPFKEEVLTCEVRVSIVSGVVGYSGCKPIPACSSGTEAGSFNRARSRLKFDDAYFLTAVPL